MRSEGLAVSPCADNGRVREGVCRCAADRTQRVGRAFSAELAVAAEALKLSGHAARRLQAEGRSLEDEEVAKLEEAVRLAASKRSRDCLVLLEDMAFVVNVDSMTVVTAVSKQRRQHGIFTNIDSVVVL
ncbi:MAG TPA: hypothetical protein GXX40_08980 [Firmicutes bacterium]|nr:hypothetical protein [Bacillota bacterium]